MKKIMFASAAALCAAVGFSSFNTVSKAFTTLYYFQVKPTDGNNIKFLNNQVTSYTGQLITNPCAPVHTGGTFKCIVGYTAGQVTAGFKFLKTATAGALTPNSITFKRTVS